MNKQYLDFDELEEAQAESARITELKARRDYWLAIQSQGKHDSIMSQRASFYVDYLDYLLGIPF